MLHIRISLGTEFQLKPTILIFWTRFTQKDIFVWKQKKELHYQILQIRICLGTKFHLKLTILIFETNLPQKGIFGWKQEKCEEYHWILHVRISLYKQFSLHKKWSFLLRISSVNVTDFFSKSTFIWGFGHNYWRNPQWKTWFFVQC